MLKSATKKGNPNNFDYIMHMLEYLPNWVGKNLVEIQVMLLLHENPIQEYFYGAFGLSNNGWNAKK